MGFASTARLALLSAAVFLAFVVRGAEGQVPDSPARHTAPAPPASVQVGEARVDPEEKTVTFPGRVNLRDVLIEYAIVGAGGKLHESVLATDVPAFQIHAAMLLLGVESHYKPRPSFGKGVEGADFQIEIIWLDEGEKQRARLEDWILRDPDGVPMERGPWLYTGSQNVDGVFTAQIEQSIVAVIEDANALAGNPRPGRENDEIWRPNTMAIPPVNTPVQIVFRLLPDRSEAQPLKPGAGAIGDPPRKDEPKN